jgi:allene oxide cyclase
MPCPAPPRRAAHLLPAAPVRRIVAAVLAGRPKEDGMARKRTILTVGIAALCALAVVPVVAGASTDSNAPASNHGQVIHVVEHAVTDTVQMFHPPASSLGDDLGFHNPVFNAADTHQIATDNGYCVRTVATGKTEWECTWTTVLAGGHITVEGPFYDDGTNTSLAITGGTGKYSGARGWMLLHARGNPLGSEFDFVFHLKG